MLKIRRVLISVSDKTGLPELARGLAKRKVEIISTGGTLKSLREFGIPAKAVSDYTGFPEILGGRVKTLHPKVFGGLLGIRTDPVHRRQMRAHAIGAIDLVVVNLYRFEEAVRRAAPLHETIEQIDIGGPSLIRAAAKNFLSVAVVTSPAQYASVLEEIQEKGGLSEKTLAGLAQRAFSLTAAYDAAIAAYFRSRVAPEEFPEILPFAFRKRAPLRYGENPHQKACFYVQDDTPATLAGAAQLHGKELSFNNLVDLDAALQAVRPFRKPAACIVKHGNPCGAAEAARLVAAFEEAFECDPGSSFGGIVGFNRTLDALTAQALLHSTFLECVIAPAYTPSALQALKEKKNLRVVRCGPLRSNRRGGEMDLRKISGGLLVQEPNELVLNPRRIKVATRRKPSAAELASLFFAWSVVKSVKSNGIVLAQGAKTVGIGAGQMSRVDSVFIACHKAGARANGSVLASDAFFPMPDGVELAAKAGVRAIIQPGGSIRDAEVIDAANRAGMAMVFTGIRHFKH